MDWQTCYTDQRTGVDHRKSNSRTEFQRDFDRIIFASSFRRLQDKTQIFPLPGNRFVHNRLTHSLEVASVGRSLGKIIGDHIADKFIPDDNTDAHQFYKTDLPWVIAAACLAHDIGNPAFGHSGEKAISNFFIQFENQKINGSRFRDLFNDHEWADLTNFEGNANALRILTQQMNGRSKGGLRLTYPTIASILKYPCDSTSINKKYKHRKKYGFFQSEKETFHTIVSSLGMIEEVGSALSYCRHPFVYIVEAADDICYRIIDMEDAHRLGILTKSTVANAFLSIIKSINRAEDDIDRIISTFQNITDDNDSITYLRAKSINTLTLESADVFTKNAEAILSGKFNDTLIDNIESRCGALKEVISISVDKVYNYHPVIEVEIAGYNVLNKLLTLFVPTILNDQPRPIDKKTMRLIPTQYKYADGSPYEKVMGILDYISGMTDSFAMNLYRKTEGIEFSNH